MAQKRVKTMVPKNDPSLAVVPKRMNTAHFEPLLSREVVRTSIVVKVS